MKSQFLPLITYCLLLLSSSFNLSAADDSEWRFSTNEKIVSVGDIHGAFDHLVSIMQKAALLDENNNWIGGKSHFISTGDIVDRGADSRKVLDLLMKLEIQAANAGGKVHVMLGNHEVMNLIGDRRYISEGEYAAFIPEENILLRKKQFKIFKNRNNYLSEKKARTNFKKIFPPGYFGLHQAFRSDGYYGSWLIQKPYVIVINKKLMVHGGLSEETERLGLEGINKQLKHDLRLYADLWYWLVDRGIFDYTMSKIDRINSAKDLIDVEHIGVDFQTEEVQDKLKQFIKVAENTILNDQRSPTWYRGTSLCHEYTEEPLYTKVLQKFGADSAYVGHTNTYSHEVESRFHGSFILQDTGMLSLAYNGQASLIIHNENSIKVLDAIHGSHEISQLSARNWYRPYGMSDAQLEAFLLSADIIDSEPVKSNKKNQFKLKLQKDNKKMYAIFNAADSHPDFENKRSIKNNKSSTNRYHNNIASYILSKILGLELVPVTVEREYDGKTGSLQYWFSKSYTVEDMIKNKIGYDGNCSQESQITLMKIFDRLIFNEGRTAKNMLYQKYGWHLWLTNNNQAFRLTTLKPYDIDWKKNTISTPFRNQLKSLNRKKLQSELRSYLNKKQIDYILKRRNEILHKTKQ